VPTYTYECKKCGHEQHEFHAMSASPRIRCVECNGVCVKMMGTGSGIIFKGSGFYETDYKKKSGSPESAPRKESGGGSDSGAAKSEKSGGTDSGAGKASDSGSSAAAPKKESKGGKSGKD
jgi:putative FmdB family regulatory protein